jgi:DNA-binding response OmpR family regulator
MKILFAEDDRKVGKHVKDALNAEGYAVDWVDDGHEALWLAENYHFDLIVLDIMLPDRDGISTYGSSGEAETRCRFCSSPRVVMYKIAPLV